MILRPRVLAMVGWRDIRRVLAGRRRFGLPALGLLLLLPAGALPVGNPLASAPRPTAAAAPVAPRVQGDVPEVLGDTVVSDPDARVRVSGASPLIVEAESLSGRLRAALAPLDGEVVAVETRTYRAPIRLPGRGLLVALIAISLLTGPLAESLPGEREERTLETLMSAAISREELIGGKWLAWTVAAGMTAVLSNAVGVLTGTVTVGAWALGVPLALAVSVASGLWLVSQARDIIGGAAAPMRVIPSVAVMLFGIAWGFSQWHPLLGAGLPLGGALLLAGGILDDAGSILVCTISSLAAALALLWATARAISRPAAQTPPQRLTLILGALVAWWLPMLGPGVWAVLDPRLQIDVERGLFAGGILLALLAASDWAQQTRPRPLRRPDGFALLWGAAIGGGLALIKDVLPVLSVNGLFADRIRAQPTQLWAIVAAVLGQELIFRWILPGRLGPVIAGICWVIIVTPLNPLLGILSGIGLWWVSRQHGLASAILAALIWRLA
ncbi:MAG: hypothetical protein AAFV53_02445 [Myxococcota bacterium]